MPATTPTTPRVYLCAAAPGTGHRSATSAAPSRATTGSSAARSSPRSTSSTVPASPVGGRQQQARLDRPERHREVGGQHRPRPRAVVDADAARDVHRDDVRRPGRGVVGEQLAEQGDDLGRLVAQRPAGADAEQPVEHDVGGHALRERVAHPDPVPRAAVDHGEDAAPGGPQRREPGAVHRRGRRHRDHRDAAAGQLGARVQRVPAVRARPHQGDDPGAAHRAAPLAQQPGDPDREPERGPLHQRALGARVEQRPLGVPDLRGGVPEDHALIMPGAPRAASRAGLSGTRPVPRRTAAPRRRG